MENEKEKPNPDTGTRNAIKVRPATILTKFARPRNKRNNNRQCRRYLALCTCTRPTGLCAVLYTLSRRSGQSLTETGQEMKRRRVQDKKGRITASATILNDIQGIVERGGYLCYG